MTTETFRLELPAGWSQRSDEERIYAVSSDPPGVLCCTPHVVENPDELPNLSRMLAGFLTRNGHPVATDELLRVTGVPNAHGFYWQYVEEETFHRIWIFGNRYSWLLMTFTAPAEHQSAFHPILNQLVKSMTLETEDLG